MIRRPFLFLAYSLGMFFIAVVGAGNKASAKTINYPASAYTIPDLIFSKDSGFYDDGFQLEIGYSDGLGIGDRRAEIYYTLDGSDPDLSAIRYEGPIEVYDRTGEYCPCHSEHKDEVPDGGVYDENRAFIIKAAAFDGGGHRSNVASGIYFIDKDEYKDKKIISLTFEYDDLFGEDGIYVDGKAYDEWEDAGMEGEEPGKNFLQRGREWERKANLLYMDDGKYLGDQDVGIRIFGASSRYYSSKRFSIISRKSYSGSDRISLSIFDDKYPVKSFVLRGGEADAIRQDLSKERDVATQQHVPVVVFLNGEYWYETFACEKYSAEYFNAHTGIEENNLIVIKEGEVSEGEESDIIFYQGIYDYISGHDLGNPEYYEEFCRMVDVQSYIDYACANLYTCNLDQDDTKNVLIYRARMPAGDGEEDGRWRWALYDMDWVKDDPEMFGADDFAKVNSFTAEPIAADCSFVDQKLFRSLVQNGDFRIKFIETFKDIIESDYSIEKSEAVLEKYGYDISWWDYFFAKRQKYMLQYLEEEFE